MSVIVSAADGSLFAVAARELGNALQWWQIASLNGLSDPSLAGLAGTLTLAMPPADSTALDGIPTS